MSNISSSFPSSLSSMPLLDLFVVAAIDKEEEATAKEADGNG